MDLTFTPEEDAFRAECRDWLTANAPRDLPSGDTREGFAAHLEWERALHAARWAVVSWPEEYGGRGASPMEWLIFEEEYYRAGGPQRVTQNGIFLLAPTVFEFGTPEQRDRILPRMAAAEDLWCQGWSEPNAGSDLAGIQSRAVRDDAAGGWRLSGQKTWTTRGAFCTHLFGLFRSDPDAERHRGLTYFLVPLDTEGVTVRGFGRLDGDEGFAEVFLDDVFVADDGVLGTVHEGWGVAMATTGSERGLTLRSPGRFMATAARLLELFGRHADAADERLRDEAVDAWIDAEAYRWQTFLTVTRMTDGEELGAESSLTKVFWSDLDVRLHEIALELLGPDAETDDTGWLKGYEFALSGPIYAGTNEIQRNVIAERVLGLPRKWRVRFAFTDDQLAFRDAVRALLDKECPPSVVRDAWTNDTGRTESVWHQLAEMGVLGVLAPEAAGGLGLSELDLVLLLEEAGRAALPEPLVEHAAVGVPLLDDASQAADGAVTITAVFSDEMVVPWGETADLLLVHREGSLYLVERSAVSLSPRTSVDHSRRLTAVEWDPSRATALAGDVAPLAFDRGALGTAAQLCGLADRMLAMTVEYVQDRTQFGVPIGSFQAVKHHLADARIALEFARPLVYRAAWSLQRDADAGPVHVSMAKAKASDAALLAGRKALQCHGAMGYSYEYDLHLFLKRAWVLAAAWGDARWHRARVRRAIL